MDSDKALQAKVGALVLFSIALLVGFVLILGNFSFAESFKIHVDFDNAGGLKPGADVAIAGLDVGTVQNLDFIRGEQDSEAGRGVAVRATLQIEKKFTDDIRKNSDFFITRRGVLGEPYIEIETPSMESPPVEEGMVLHGAEPPRMDVIVSKATDLLDNLTSLLEDPDIALTELIGNTASVAKQIDALLETNRTKISKTVGHTEAATQEARALLQSLNRGIDDGRRLRDILNHAQAMTRNASSVSKKVNRDIEPLLANTKKTSEDLRKTTEIASNLLQQNEPKVTETISNTQKMSGDARAVIHRLESGKGTVGRLLADREIYDNMKELMRVLKQRPWKIIWKE
jgi:phospholipid/cholesterol/gamma-HCH transport system substrate-binding protein